MEDCNKCRCSNDGQKACTRKMCPPKELSDDAQVRTEPVPNGDSLSSADEKDEVHLQTNGQVCTPNEIKMQECNRCRCANNGIGWFCTRRVCPPREKRAAVTTKCTPGSTFMADDGCNTCYCDAEGRAACSLKFCASSDVSAFRSRLQRRQANEFPGMQKCTPGTTFRDADDCNTCYCNEDGRAACTRKACIKKDSELYKQLQQARESSNSDASLTADTDGQRQRRQVKEIKCTPGTTFKSDDGCNNCFCDESGQAACTLMACLPNTERVQQKRQTSGDLPQTAIAPGTPGFSCTPRSSFKYQCNTCLCSDDGKNAGCTFKFCIPGEW